MNLYYCYSPNLNGFLKSLGLKYIKIGFNEKTQSKYWAYEKSQNLDNAIIRWNKLKEEIKLEVNKNERKGSSLAGRKN